jgi:hypothetical protein
MHFVAGLIITGLMAALPLVFAVDLSHPPIALTGWIVFVGALFGLLGLLQFGLIKYILKPAIMEEMKDLPSRKEFNDHVSTDSGFQESADDFMNEVRVFMGVERREFARRKGDPR